MKKYIHIINFITVSLLFSGCNTLKEVKGTYVSFTPLVDVVFDWNHYDIIGFAYTPESSDGKIFKNSLAAVFVEERFKVITGKDEIDSIAKSGIKFNQTVNIEDAQKLGKIMQAKAMIIIKRAEFTGNGKASYISLDIVDTYGGVLIRAVYRGGDSPDDIERAARSIVYAIQTENLKIEAKMDMDIRL